jgi:hypothetical protein
MSTSRRNFIRTTAAVSLFGAPAAHAAANDPWLGFVHTTSLDSDLQLAFYQGLNNKGYEADPTKLNGSNKRVNILSRQANGKYKKGRPDEIERAIKDITDTVSAQAIVAVGGLISAQTAAAYLSRIGSPIPLVIAVGRQATWGYSKVEGIYFDDFSGTANNSMQKKVADLTSSTKYAVARDKICFLYNDNSVMGSLELRDLTSILGTAPSSVDASNGGENKDIKLRNVFVRLTNTGAQAVIVSADAYFSKHIPQIVRLAGKRTLIMCYPLLDYGDEAQDADQTVDHFMARGPRLAQVYTRLGEIAGQRLQTPGGSFNLEQAAPDYIGLP